MAATDPARFTLVFRGEGVVTDPTGIWRPLSTPSSFSVPGGDEGVWGVRLPGDIQVAARALELKADRLSEAELSLGIAARLINSFVRESREGGPPVPSAANGDELRRDLVDWREAMTGAESFGWGGNVWGPLGEAAREVCEFFGQVIESLTSFARIETSFYGLALARTRVSWRGTFETVWPDGIDTERAGLHIRVVDLALDTRRSWLGLILGVIRGAIELGALLATGAWFMAIPAAWRVFRRLLADIDSVRGASGATGNQG
jgi:hypothetical protein